MSGNGGRWLALTIAACLAAPGSAQRSSTSLEQRFDPSQDIGIDQRLGETLPLAARFRDETGAEVELGSVFGGRPAVLALVYYDCPMLCKLVSNGILDSTRVLALEPGEDYSLVFVSIDPSEGPELASAMKASFLTALERPEAGPGVHFLTGEQDAIDAVARSAGFRYAYDERTGEYAHASGIMVATADGRLSRYLFGVEYSARDLRLSLVEAADGEIGSLMDQVLLLCYSYDPTTGRYGLAIMATIRALGVLTLLVLLTFVLRSLRRDRAGVRAGARAAGEVGG